MLKISRFILHYIHPARYQLNALFVRVARGFRSHEAVRVCVIWEIFCSSPFEREFRASADKREISRGRSRARRGGKSIEETHDETYDEGERAGDGVTSRVTGHKKNRRKLEETACPWAFDNLSGGRIKGHGNAAGLAGTGRGVLRLREHEGEATDYQTGTYRGTSATDQVLPPGDPSHVPRLQAGTFLLTYQAPSIPLRIGLSLELANTKLCRGQKHFYTVVFIAIFITPSL